MQIHWNAGIMQTNLIRDLPGYGEYEFTKTALQAYYRWKMSKKLQVTYGYWWIERFALKRSSGAKNEDERTID